MPSSNSRPRGIFIMFCNMLLLTLLSSQCGALPVPKTKTAITARQHSYHCSQVIDYTNGAACNDTQLNAEIRSFLDLSLERKMAYASNLKLRKELPDLEKYPRGTADKGRYIPSLTRMCEALGLRNCLKPLQPSTKKHRRNAVPNRPTKKQSDHVERLKFVRVAKENAKNKDSVDTALLAREETSGCNTSTRSTPDATDVGMEGKKGGGVGR